MICQTESHGPQIKFTFYKGNNSIPNNGPSNDTLTITSAGKTNDGKYSCQVEINGIKSVSSSTQIIRVIGKNVLFILLVLIQCNPLISTSTGNKFLCRYMEMLI